MFVFFQLHDSCWNVWLCGFFIWIPCSAFYSNCLQIWHQRSAEARLGMFHTGNDGRRLHDLKSAGHDEKRQTERGYRSHLTAIEFFRKCLLVILISNLAAVPVCYSSVWVSWFFVSTLLWPLARWQTRGAVNLYIWLFVFPSHPHSSLRWTVTSPPLSINPTFAIWPRSWRCRVRGSITQSTFSTRWNLRTYKRNLAWICTFPLRLINQGSWEPPHCRLVLAFLVNWLRNRK